MFQFSITITEDAVGATIIFEDDCVYGYVARQNRTGVIEAVTDSKHHGHYLTVAVPGFNLPKVIRQEQIIAFTHPSLTNKTAETAETISA
jgi:hypothetical protein